jgi:hypothetical protein
LSKEQIAELKRRQSDSITFHLDSLLSIEVHIPPLFDIQQIDSTTVSKFFALANSTQGELKVLVDSKLISGEIKYIIENHSRDSADILFLIDKTGSMVDDILNVKRGLKQIVQSIEKHRNVRIGVALYGDKNSDGNSWYSFKNFETNYELVKDFIEKIEVTDGDDYPESVYDGFFQTMKENFWKSKTKRMILLVGDAPPLEKPLSEFTIDDVIDKASKERIKMNFYPIIVSVNLFDESLEIHKVKSFESAKLISSYYPNPSKGRLNIKFIVPGEYEFEIYNHGGSLKRKDKVKGNRLSLEFYDYESGVYSIRITSSDAKFETIKIVVEL